MGKPQEITRVIISVTRWCPWIRAS